MFCEKVGTHEPIFTIIAELDEEDEDEDESRKRRGGATL